MIAALTRIAALAIVVFFALTSILWGSTAARAADGLSISGTVYLDSEETPATTGDAEVEYTVVGQPHDAADVVPLNADGTYTISGVSTGSYFIYYHYLGTGNYASKYQSQESTITAPFSDTGVALGETDLTGLQEVLELKGSISGHVSIGSSTTSAAADEVTVTASVYAGDNGASVYTTLPTVNTDASGNYTIPGVTPGSHWRLLFTYNGTGAVQSIYYGEVNNDDGQDFTVAASQAVTKDQTLPNLMSIAGTVYLGSTATPAGAGAVTLQLREYDGNTLNSNVIASTVTVAGGGYSFQGLDNRKFQLTAVAPTGYTDSMPVDYTATTASANVTLAPVVAATYTLTGHIDIGVVGTSAKAGEIYVGLFKNSDQETLLAVTSTNASGNYSFPGLAADTYVVVASSYNHNDQRSWPYYSDPITVGASGSTAPNAVMQVTIAGQILSPTNTPLAGITVTATEYDTQTSESARAFTTTTDANGNYHFAELSWGVYPDTTEYYVVLAHDASGQYASLVYNNTSPYYQPDFITVTQNNYGTTHTADFDMPLANHIAGTVSGVPTADLANSDVTIEVQVLDFSTSEDGVWFGTGDIWPVAANGSYNVGDLPDDAYRLVFTDDGAGGTLSLTSPEFDLSGGQTAAYSPNLAPVTATPNLPSGSPIGSLDAVTASTGQVTVGGWALDPDSLGSIPVHLYIDGVFQGQVQAEQPRSDIAAAFPAYGANHGYSVTLVNVPGGTHNVCAYGINTGPAASNSSLGCKTVTVPVANPFGSLDAVTWAGPGTVSVAGWAADGDATAPMVVHIYLDGAFRTGLTVTDSRPDVSAAYPGIPTTSGYSAKLTDLAAGTHTVCAYAINQGSGTVNTQLGCRSVNVAGGTPFGSVDAVAASGLGSVTVAGWTIDPDTAASLSVHVYVDGVFRTGLTADGPRSDVAAAYSGFGADHGFSATLTGLTGGTHQVCLYAINQLVGTTNPVLGCGTVSLPTGSPFGSVDAVTGVSGGISVEGWAIDPDTAASIDLHVYLDGVFQTGLTASENRSDVAAAYPLYGAAHGFSATVDATPGGHVVCLYGINQGANGSNSTIGGKCSTVTVPVAAAPGA